MTNAGNQYFITEIIHFFVLHFPLFSMGRACCSWMKSSGTMEVEQITLPDKSNSSVTVTYFVGYNIYCNINYNL